MSVCIIDASTTFPKPSALPVCHISVLAILGMLTSSAVCCHFHADSNDASLRITDVSVIFPSVTGSSVYNMYFYQVRLACLSHFGSFCHVCKYFQVICITVHVYSARPFGSQASLALLCAILHL